MATKKTKTVVRPVDSEESPAAKVVGTVRKKSVAHVGKPSKLSKSAQRITASAGSGSYFSPSSSGGIGGGYGGIAGYSGYGGHGGGSGSITTGSGGNYYSPELSTDFLELPQSIDEKRNFYRFFYANDPFVGQAIDLHVELPLSKVRIGIPRSSKKEFEDLARESFRFCQRWVSQIDLMQKLIQIGTEYNLLGEVFIYVEDDNPDMPKEIMFSALAEGEEAPEGSEIEEEDGVRWVKREDGDERATKWLRENYKGWTDLKIIPPERVDVVAYPYTNERSYSLRLGSDAKSVYDKAISGDPEALRILKTMPTQIVEAMSKGENGILLNTDPEKGAFLIHLTRKRSGYDVRGRSVLERCMRTLVHRDKIRQALASIASRHMTPIRLISVEGGDEMDVMNMREQIDLSLMDPDYSIVTNFPVQWEEMGADQRIPDWSSEFDRTDRLLYAGLGVTESLLSGESSYSGDRINLEVINTRYMLFRETIQHLVQKQLLEPMCNIMGFAEIVDGVREVLTPPMSFTRLALRDNSDTFDHLFNLYQKGSLSVETIFELLNLDPRLEHDRIMQEMFTVRDSTFNEALRGAYGEVGRKMGEETDMFNKISDNLGLKILPKKDDRF